MQINFDGAFMEEEKNRSIVARDQNGQYILADAGKLPVVYDARCRVYACLADLEAGICMHGTVKFSSRGGYRVSRSWQLADVTS